MRLYDWSKVLQHKLQSATAEKRMALMEEKMGEADLYIPTKNLKTPGGPKKCNFNKRQNFRTSHGNSQGCETAPFHSANNTILGRLLRPN